MPLRCPAQLILRNGAVQAITTENLSNCGFYCQIDTRLMPGEEFDCYIRLSSNHIAGGGEPLVLACRGRVARVEALSGNSYGVGCQIDDYLVLPT